MPFLELYSITSVSRSANIIRSEEMFGFKFWFHDAEKHTTVVFCCTLVYTPVAAAMPAITLENYKEWMCSSELGLCASPSSHILGCMREKGHECTGTYTLQGYFIFPSTISHLPKETWKIASEAQHRAVPAFPWLFSSSLKLIIILHKTSPHAD